MLCIVLSGRKGISSGTSGGKNKGIHVSEDRRGQKIGEELFLAAKKWAAEHGAAKLYISVHSAVESQGFYKKMGCVEATVCHKGHVEKEPFDCQLECLL